MRHLLLLLLLGPLAAHAESRGNLDLYFIPSAKLDVEIPGFGSADDDGDGFGVRGSGALSDNAVLTGEYQSASYDDSDLDIDQLRLGVGLTAADSGSGLFVEYVDVDFDGDEADGFGIHGRLASKASDVVSVYGQVGYLSVKDDFEKNTGLEFSVGATFWINDTAGVFGDFRQSNLEGEDSEIELELTDLRVGIRIGL